ncbi:kinase-like domain-containing protein [Phaeosphaeria sp. MPI-PUGE-AT-0046c]|nr:kinase-like domain-containing protein [Phaeosphaeria sp. MPI-PUGE-AT-0046c]
MNDWNTHNRDHVRRHKRIGRRWYEKFCRVPSRGTATGTGHFYDTIHTRPAPTITDISHVNRRTDVGGHGAWKFERTIYSNRHHERGARSYRRIVHLFARIDDFGRILDQRMAVKVQGEDNMSSIRDIIFREYNWQKWLNGAHSAHILEARARSYRSRATAPRHLGYIYLDWAPYGSLSDLICNSPPSRQFPEPMLWLIFRGLAEALHVHYTGWQPGRAHPPPHLRTLQNSALLMYTGWGSLVNTDIKLANVVLGQSRPDFYPAYKTAQMIDFGLVVPETSYIDREAKKRNGRYREIGTPGSRPPEQFHPPHPKHTQTPINVLSDTWNVGKIMFELLEQRYITADTNNFHFEHGRDYSHVYSHALESLVAQCVKVDPKHRPHLNELLYRTSEGLRNWERVYGDVSGEDVDPKWTWAWSKEEFRIGDHVPSHWRWGREVVDEPSDSDDDDDDDDIEERLRGLFEGDVGADETSGDAHGEADDEGGEESENAKGERTAEEEGTAESLDDGGDLIDTEHCASERKSPRFKKSGTSRKGKERAKEGGEAELEKPLEDAERPIGRVVEVGEEEIEEVVEARASGSKKRASADAHESGSGQKRRKSK